MRRAMFVALAVALLSVSCTSDDASIVSAGSAPSAAAPRMATAPCLPPSTSLPEDAPATVEASMALDSIDQSLRAQLDNLTSVIVKVAAVDGNAVSARVERVLFDYTTALPAGDSRPGVAIGDLVVACNATLRASNQLRVGDAGLFVGEPVREGGALRFAPASALAPYPAIESGRLDLGGGDVVAIDEVAHLAGRSKRPLERLPAPVSTRARVVDDHVEVVVDTAFGSPVVVAYCPAGSVDLTATEAIVIQRCTPASPYSARDNVVSPDGIDVSSPGVTVAVLPPAVGVDDPSSVMSGVGVVDYVLIASVDGQRRAVGIAPLTAG